MKGIRIILVLLLAWFSKVNKANLSIGTKIKTGGLDVST